MEKGIHNNTYYARSMQACTMQSTITYTSKIIITIYLKLYAEMCIVYVQFAECIRSKDQGELGHMHQP